MCVWLINVYMYIVHLHVRVLLFTAHDQYGFTLFCIPSEYTSPQVIIPRAIWMVFFAPWILKMYMFVYILSFVWLQRLL